MYRLCPRPQDTREGYPYHGRPSPLHRVAAVAASLVHGTDTPRGYPGDGLR